MDQKRSQRGSAKSSDVEIGADQLSASPKTVNIPHDYHLTNFDMKGGFLSDLGNKELTEAYLTKHIDKHRKSYVIKRGMSEFSSRSRGDANARGVPPSEPPHLDNFRLKLKEDVRLSSDVAHVHLSNLKQSVVDKDRKLRSGTNSYKLVNEVPFIEPVDKVANNNFKTSHSQSRRKIIAQSQLNKSKMALRGSQLAVINQASTTSLLSAEKGKHNDALVAMSSKIDQLKEELRIKDRFV